jgi:serine/threonine protein phosphatase PrpC
VELRANSRTDVGRQRSNNEDCPLSAPQLGLYGVCDGMGGHAAGEVASATAVRTVQEHFERHRDALANFDDSALAVERVRAVMRGALEAASAKVYELAQTGHGRHGMGTTCTALVVVGGKGVMGHVGDSRLYLWRDGQLHAMSEDHTYANEAIRSGMLSEAEAKASPYANMVTRGIGPQPSVHVDTLVFDVLPGDTFVLCSDGLHGYVDTHGPEFLEIMRQGDARGDLAERLVDFANRCGGVDNVTAVVVHAQTTDATRLDERLRQVGLNLNVMRAVVLFQDMDLKELVAMMNSFHPARFGPGVDVVTEGEDGEGLFVVTRGELDVIRSGKLIARLSAGSHFGEMALLSRRPRSATVRSTTDTDVLVMQRKDFMGLLAHNPGVGVKFMWKLAQILSLRLDDAYLVGHEGRKTQALTVLSPFQR